MIVVGADTPAGGAAARALSLAHPTGRLVLLGTNVSTLRLLCGQLDGAGGQGCEYVPSIYDDVPGSGSGRTGHVASYRHIDYGGDGVLLSTIGDSLSRIRRSALTPSRQTRGPRSLDVLVLAHALSDGTKVGSWSYITGRYNTDDIRHSRGLFTNALSESLLSTAALWNYAYEHLARGLGQVIVLTPQALVAPGAAHVVASQAAVASWAASVAAELRVQPQAPVRLASLVVEQGGVLVPPSMLRGSPPIAAIDAALARVGDAVVTTVRNGFNGVMSVP
eukprot:CAMPEP_0170737364 /NCGR_PEP_ID=MMETSP0437-20130122/4087_1 /TAXON_ID=0 /ORGANISM="Sexangularia sp." /LENGTH=277 /DNA_ID=CAMNT_0011075745 /DNA_START=126 /DNA_END=959 /DNA_ORIENTATION=+